MPALGDCKADAGASLSFRRLADSAPIALAAGGATILIAGAAAIYHLRGTPYALDWSAALSGASAVIDSTLWAALKVWAFWAVAAGVIAGWLLRFDPDLDLSDALLGGALGLWCLAYAFGMLLGPIGLFRAVTVWAIAIAGAGWLWWRPPAVRIRLRSPTAGQMLALTAIALALVSLLILQLASPVVPYMDVLSYPASVQRILTFGRYLPFDNDPYGCWGPQAQTPALELFYAMLAMGSRTSLAVLAESAAMAPMFALMIFATYRLGRTLFSDSSGGMAALALFFTVLFRRAEGMRGTAVVFALIAAGLAFLLDSRRSRTLTALGAVMLGTAVASHAINGGLAVAVAAGSALIWLADRDFERTIVAAVALVGAVLLAVPEFAVATAIVLPYPTLPLVQLIGLAVIVVAARRLNPRADPGGWTPWINQSLVIALIGAAIARQVTSDNSLVTQLAHQYPLLMLSAALAVAAIVLLGPARTGNLHAGTVAIALLLAIFIEQFAPIVAHLGSAARFQAAVGDLGYKLDEYWSPFWMAVAMGLGFGLVYDRGSKPLAVVGMLALLIFPWYQKPGRNDDYEEHSIAENWGIDLNTAARGYWGSTADSRWTMGADEFALVETLYGEIAAGRITPATHILHIANDVIVWHDLVRASVFTGIDEDPIVYNIPGSDIAWLAGGRVRPIDQLADALESRPPYILIQTALPRGFPPGGYDQIFGRGMLRLYRRTDLAPVAGRAR